MSKHWTTREAVDYATDRGCTVKRQTGSHIIVEAPNHRTAVVPNRHGELPAGTESSIKRMYKVMGIMVAVGILMLLAIYLAPAI